MKSRLLSNITPGEILDEEFLKPLAITQYRLAKDIGVPPRRINEIVKGQRAITADTALRLGLDLASRFPFEMGVFPKSHSSAFSRISPGQIENLARILRDVLQKLDKTLGGPPYNLALQDRPFLRPREGYWKTIDDDYHWHIELVPRLTQIAGFEWGTGFYINPTSPEDAAAFLREADV